MTGSPAGTYEAVLHRQGFRLVAGIDEAGRGALAGPLVAAAVILPVGWVPDGLADSKLLTPAQRDRLYVEITAGAVAVGVRRVTPQRLDRVGLQRANLVALRGAYKKLDPAPDYVLVDGFALDRMVVPTLKMVKGDRISTAVAAASVVAKVTRDRYMIRAAKRYRGYGFVSNKGYRAPTHLEALRHRGPCPLHRRWFAEVAAVVGPPDGSVEAPSADPGSSARTPTIHPS